MSSVIKNQLLLNGLDLTLYCSQDKDVAFIERLPLSLKNLVSNTSTKGGAKACMDQMMSVIECMGKFDQNQTMCTKEINAFQTCYSNFQVQYEKSRAFR